MNIEDYRQLDRAARERTTKTLRQEAERVGLSLAQCIVEDARLELAQTFPGAQMAVFDVDDEGDEVTVEAVVGADGKPMWSQDDHDTTSEWLRLADEVLAVEELLEDALHYGDTQAFTPWSEKVRRFAIQIAS